MNNPLIITSRKVAIISFILGTIIFFAQLFLFAPDELFVLGFLYLLMAIAINLIFAIALLAEIFFNSSERKILLQSLGILLINIPVAFIYMIVVFNQNGLFMD